MNVTLKAYAQSRVVELLDEAAQLITVLAKDRGSSEEEAPTARELLTEARRLLAKNKDTSLASFDISLALDRINGRSRHGLLRQASA